MEFINTHYIDYDANIKHINCIEFNTNKNSVVVIE